MGAKFSKDPGDFQLLAKDKNGQLHVYTEPKPEKLNYCTAFPFPMEQNVAYAFLSTTDSSLNPHVYNDNECDVTGNDSVTLPTPWQNKTVNTIQYNGNSNSNYFMLDNIPVNTPKFGIFVEQGGQEVRAAKSSFTQCKEMPYKSRPKNSNVKDDITYDHDTIPMVFYTDAQCMNEYISPIPVDPNSVQTLNRQYNVNNRALNPEELNLPYTDVRALDYAAPSDKTNAKYYRSHRPDYPDEINT